MNKLLFKNVDNAPLVVFRIFLGFLIACEGFGAIFTGWITKTLVEPTFTFSFIGFEWLQPLPGNGMYYYFAVMGILGLCIMLGYRYVITMTAYTVLWAGVYFMQKSSYNNHYYLLMLVCFLMIFLPANKDKSLDVKLKYTNRNTTMPYWVNSTFIVLIGFVYTYAAIAKFYPDWLDGTYTKNLLNRSTLYPYFSELFSAKWFYLFIAYAGIFYDLLIVPLLLNKKTRTIALICSLFFHLFNSINLLIGIFPYFALSLSVFFYNPSAIRKFFFRETIKIDTETLNYERKKIWCYIFVPFLIIQFALPLRHHFIKGDVLWTEEGHRLSWRMMLRSRSGFINIKVRNNKTNETKRYDYHKNLTSKQAHQLATKPDFIWQYCQKIKEEYKNDDISIFVECKNGINGKSYQTLINPEFDMAKAKWNYFFHNEWILLNEN